jgi:hypothetical protein
MLTAGSELGRWPFAQSRSAPSSPSGSRLADLPRRPRALDGERVVGTERLGVRLVGAPSHPTSRVHRLSRPGRARLRDGGATGPAGPQPRRPVAARRLLALPVVALLGALLGGADPVFAALSTCPAARLKPRSTSCSSPSARGAIAGLLRTASAGSITAPVPLRQGRAETLVTLGSVVALFATFAAPKSCERQARSTAPTPKRRARTSANSSRWRPSPWRHCWRSGPPPTSRVWSRSRPVPDRASATKPRG